jgi:hypothetical protein
MLFSVNDEISLNKLSVPAVVIPSTSLASHSCTITTSIQRATTILHINPSLPRYRGSLQLPPVQLKHRLYQPLKVLLLFTTFISCFNFFLLQPRKVIEPAGASLNKSFNQIKELQ